MVNFDFCVFLQLETKLMAKICENLAIYDQALQVKTQFEDTFYYYYYYYYY